jgi:16S rRNA (cytidine1402-2'-O)-methyltransferase
VPLIEGWELIIVARRRPSSQRIERVAADSASPAVSRGTLYVVATPIGNLQDLGERARQVLAAAQWIAAEDTRHSLKLLQAHGIEARLLSVHEHNEIERVPEILAALEHGASVALVSDAGTPLVSDPGARLVRAAIDAGFEVRAVPGPCAAIAALSISGLATDRFAFEGFLPQKPVARRARLAQLASDPRTLIFYEAPHRVSESIADMSAVLGASRPAALARELTKVFETVYRGTLEELTQRVQQDSDMQRGEIVIVVGGAAPASDEAGRVELERVVSVLAAELPASQAAELAAKLTGASRNQAYRLALELSGKRT